MLPALPPLADQYLPVLVHEIQTHWQGVPIPSALAAQIEQETCISLKHKKCWSPRAELKTSREYGFGLGQITKTAKFDNFQTMRKLHPSLATWSWEDRFDPQMQLRSLVLYDKALFSRILGAHDPTARLAMTFAAYNGGAGGLSQDRKICAAVKGCDPSQWFGHVELHSLKSRTKVGGYGQSFFDVNRGYVRNIMVTRRGKYEQHMERLK